MPIPAVPTVSVVVPVLNDAAALRHLMADLRALPVEIVVVDGGSSDDSLQVAAAADRFGSSQRGRAWQLNAGVAMSRGEWVWFLHADSRVDMDVAGGLFDSLARPGWGFCQVRLDGKGWVFRVIENAITWRSAATGIATGDQGIFVHRELLAAVHGVPSQLLMEDIELCLRLRRLAKPRRVRRRLVTSSRRWQRDGVVGTVVLMWWLRLRYFLGADADALARHYHV